MALWVVIWTLSQFPATVRSTLINGTQRKLLTARTRPTIDLARNNIQRGHSKNRMRLNAFDSTVCREKCKTYPQYGFDILPIVLRRHPPCRTGIP